MDRQLLLFQEEELVQALPVLQEQTYRRHRQENYKTADNGDVVIYESPDGGKTVYARVTGQTGRELVDSAKPYAEPGYYKHA